jgi:HMG (high mobility group) box
VSTIASLIRVPAEQTSMMSHMSCAAHNSSISLPRPLHSNGPHSAPTTRPEHLKKLKAKTRISRPPNAFLLFRSDLWAREKQKPNPVERDHRGISRIAAHCWRNLDVASKQKYYERAVRLREAHQTRYPEYKYTPATRKTASQRVKMRVGRKMPEEDARCARLASSIMSEVVSATKQESATLGGTFEVGSNLNCTVNRAYTILGARIF